MGELGEEHSCLSLVVVVLFRASGFLFLEAVRRAVNLGVLFRAIEFVLFVYLVQPEWYLVSLYEVRDGERIFRRCRDG